MVVEGGDATIPIPPLPAVTTGAAAARGCSRTTIQSGSDGEKAMACGTHHGVDAGKEGRERGPGAGNEGEG